MIRKILISTLLLTLTLSGFSQNVTKFPTDSVGFFEEMNYFITYSRKEEGKYMMEEFSYDWYGGKFSETQKAGIYRLANLMLRKKKRAFPDFKIFLKTLTSFVNSEQQTEERFEDWKEILTKLLKRRGRGSSRRFTDYLNACNDLFKENVLYTSAANTWAADNDNYTFEYDSLPKFVFPALTLTCYSKGDSSVIYNTKGIYYPTEKKWIGEGGKITWERAGFSADSVYAEIDKYNISVKSPRYVANNVIFYDYNYFSEPLRGNLKEKVLANVTVERASYPRFESKGERYTLKIAERVEYEGGYALHGRKVIGKGTEEDKAQIIFRIIPDSITMKEEDFLKMSAISFQIQPEKIVSQEAAAVFYLNEDSIFHPGVLFKFFIKKREVTFIRDNKGVKITPYFNSYHKVDMDFEILRWNIDDPMIEFENITGGTRTHATFVSSEYFRLRTYLKMMGLDMQHPLYQVKSLVDKLDTNFIHVQQLSRHIRLPLDQIDILLLKLENSGFIQYNYNDKSFIVHDKLINWVRASGGNIDYDVIGFFSDTKGEKGISNATLSLLNYDILIRGVKSITVSDSQEVVIYPALEEIRLKKNRDFTFTGVVQAGRFDIIGRNFAFLYDEFKIDMPYIDSLRIYAEIGQEDAYGQEIIKPVTTVIQQISGDLLIDKPTNKSGVKVYSQYPVFNSYKDAYVFYDRGSIQKGAYKQEDDFYFHVDPFKIDSLDNFNNKGLRFGGTFVSGGIFPEFKEILRLQPDHSLGFVRKSPPGGFPMYGGKGTFTNKISMSHRGLKGIGKIDFITSTTYSDDFLLLPKEVNGVAQKFTIKEKSTGAEYAAAQGENVAMVWFPEKDTMIHEKIDKPIAMYDMKSVLHGKTIIEKTGLSGSGLFEFEKAELESKLIHFKAKKLNSDTADFRLKDDLGGGEGALAFKTENVNAFVDFEERYGEFKSNGGGSFIEFPANMYKCFMEEFKWYMDDDQVEMTAGGQQSGDALGVKLDGAKFISTNPDQDSLSFYSTKAIYDLKKKIINAKGVLFIAVADAMIYPDSSNIIVERDARIRTLKKAKIVANYVTKKYNIYDAKINIFGKRDYTGSGYIDYINEVDSALIIDLQNIGVDNTGQTYATGKIADTEGFTLSPNFEYYGKVKLFANKDFLTFDGYFRIRHECTTLKRNWIRMNTEIDPLEIYIPIDTTIKDVGKNSLIAGVFLNSDPTLYSSFLNNSTKYGREEVISAYGFLYYDKESGEYKISNKDKIQEMSFTGSYLSLKPASCKVYGEGMITLGADLGQVKIQSAGVVQHNLVDNEAIFDLLMSVDFYFFDDGLKKLGNHLQESGSLDPTKLDRKTYEKGLREILGKEEADKIIAQLNLYGELKKVPEELRKTLTLSDAKFKWNEVSKSYKSFGRIGISNIGKMQINKYVDGKIEILRKRSGDVLTIYLELDKNNWYFFNYTRGIMQVISSNIEFNQAIKSVKPDDRKEKVEKGQQSYQFMYSTERKKTDFLRKFGN